MKWLILWVASVVTVSGAAFNEGRKELDESIVKTEKEHTDLKKYTGSLDPTASSTPKSEGDANTSHKENEETGNEDGTHYNADHTEFKDLEELEKQSPRRKKKVSKMVTKGFVGDAIKLAKGPVNSLLHLKTGKDNPSPAAGDVVNNLKPAAGNVVNNLQPAAGDVVNNLKPAAGDVVNNLKPAAGDVVNNLKPAAGDVVNNLKPAAGNVLNNLNNVPGGSPLTNLNKVHIDSLMTVAANRLKPKDKRDKVNRDDLRAAIQIFSKTIMHFLIIVSAKESNNMGASNKASPDGPFKENMKIALMDTAAAFLVNFVIDKLLPADEFISRQDLNTQSSVSNYPPRGTSKT